MRGRYYAPRFENALGIDGIPTIIVAIGVQPFEQPVHVVSGRFPRSGWLDSQNAVAIGFWSKQYLLEVEPGRLNHNQGRFAGPSWVGDSGEPCWRPMR